MNDQRAEDLQKIRDKIPGRRVSPLDEREAHQAKGMATTPKLVTAAEAAAMTGPRTVAGFTIEKGLPPPSRTTGAVQRVAEAMEALEIGESFLVAGARTLSPYHSAKQALARAEKVKGRGFSAQINSAGIRIWRTK